MPRDGKTEMKPAPKETAKEKRARIRLERLSQGIAFTVHRASAVSMFREWLAKHAARMKECLVNISAASKGQG
eukprot:1768717-Prorocentrum_lima.AAC.1